MQTPILPLDDNESDECNNAMRNEDGDQDKWSKAEQAVLVRLTAVS
jgi:hypothetical protein